jgi:hypothetical protein
VVMGATGRNGRQAEQGHKRDDPTTTNSTRHGGTPFAATWRAATRPGTGPTDRGTDMPDSESAGMSRGARRERGGIGASAPIPTIGRTLLDSSRTSNRSFSSRDIDHRTGRG